MIISSGIVHVCLSHHIPVLIRLLQMLDPIFKLSLLFGQLSHLSQRVFASIVFEDGEAVSQVLILLCKLENLSITIVEIFRLALDCFSQGKVPLQYFFHHVDGVNDSFSDSILALIGCTMRL